MSNIGRFYLGFDNDALKQKLRFAFANSETVIQELMQNARRAGANGIWIETGEDAEGQPTLTVMDDGCGIGDFSVLLENKGRSGWDKAIQQREGAYGMGFLSVIYSCSRTLVRSQGVELCIDTQEVLKGQACELMPMQVALRDGVSTAITLWGLDVERARARLASLSEGFALPVEVDGQAMQRDAALTDAFVETEVGWMQCGLSYVGDPRIYLQGFCVYGGDRVLWRQDIVHLDERQWFGKFPDRDRVIEEKAMLQAVDKARRDHLTKRLLDAKCTLAPWQFMSTYRNLAEKLGRLDVFNDIDSVPSAWLATIFSPPRDEEGRPYLEASGADGMLLTRSALQAENAVVADLGWYDAEEGGNACAWQLAYACGAMVLDKRLHDEHWLYDLVQVTDETEVTIAPVGEVVRGSVDERRSLQQLFGVDVVLCEGVRLQGAGKDVVLREPMGLYRERCGFDVYVPRAADAAPMYVNEYVLQQLDSYLRDDDLQEEDLEADTRAVNEVARALSARSPEARVAMALEAAIRDYRDLRGLGCAVEIDAVGAVKVSTLRMSA